MPLMHFLSRAERLHGAHTALIAGRRRLTVAELADRARRLAAGLQALGAGHGDRVAILAANRPEFVETYWAGLLAGAILVPLNSRLNPREWAELIDDAEPRVLLAEAPLLERLVPALGDLNHPPRLVSMGGAAGGATEYEALLADADPAAREPRKWELNDPTFIFYTGGTTGRAKGVVLTTRNALANLRNVVQALELAGGDRWLCQLPLFHTGAYWWAFAMPALGIPTVLPAAFDPEETLRLIERERITVAGLVPTMIYRLLDSPQRAKRDLSSLRRVQYGSAPMALERLRAAVATFGPVFQQFYGQTEAAPFVAATPREALDPGEDETAWRRLNSCGRELLGVEVQVRDERGPLKTGEPGEVWVRGENVMSGYWRRPTETAEALRDHWLRTGDVGLLDTEGFLHLLDRAKDVVVSGGESVFCPEVENALFHHPAVAEAAVIGVPDDTWGEAVKAVVVLRPEATVTPEDLIAHCHEWIAGYKCPKSVDIVERLPRSAMGKVLKAELRAPYWAGQERGVH